MLLAGTAKPNVPFPIRGRIVRIERKDTGIRAIAPIATAQQRSRNLYPFVLFKVTDNEFFTNLRNCVC
jgi:hypothetical protein